jgi:hypothetical protein
MRFAKATARKRVGGSIPPFTAIFTETIRTVRKLLGKQSPLNRVAGSIPVVSAIFKVTATRTRLRLVVAMLSGHLS